MNGQPLEPDWLHSMEKLAEQPNVYVKVSGHMEASTVQPAPTSLEWYLPLFNALWSLFGERGQLFYGSNWPVCDRAPGAPPEPEPEPEPKQRRRKKDAKKVEPEPEPEPESESEPEPEPEPEPPYLTQLRLTQQFFDYLDAQEGEGGDPVSFWVSAHTRT